jgi:hypothetical protein
MNQAKTFAITRDTNFTALAIYNYLYCRYVQGMLDPFFPSVYLLEDELTHVPQHLRAMYTRVYNTTFTALQLK